MSMRVAKELPAVEAKNRVLSKVKPKFCFILRHDFDLAHKTNLPTKQRRDRPPLFRSKCRLRVRAKEATMNTNRDSRSSSIKDILKIRFDEDANANETDVGWRFVDSFDQRHRWKMQSKVPDTSDVQGERE